MREAASGHSSRVILPRPLAPFRHRYVFSAAAFEAAPHSRGGHTVAAKNDERGYPFFGSKFSFRRIGSASQRRSEAARF
jgi:hypothetical protein